METILFLCDELEEFSRYGRSETTHEWQEAHIRTEIEIQKNKLLMMFTLKDSMSDREFGSSLKSFMDEKANKLERRFSMSEDGITEISVICKDITKSNHPESSFTWKFGSEPKRLYPV